VHRSQKGKKAAVRGQFVESKQMVFSDQKMMVPTHEMAMPSSLAPKSQTLQSQLVTQYQQAETSKA